MIELKGYIDIPRDNLDQVCRALPLHTKLTLEETGCIMFSVVQDETEKMRFHVHEQFTNQQAFEFHQLRVQSSAWGEITKPAKRSYQVIER